MDNLDRSGITMAPNVAQETAVDRYVRLGNGVRAESSVDFSL